MNLKCPVCNVEMKIYGEPQITAAPVKTKEEKFPSKLVCSVMTVYACDKCPVKAVYSENKDYLPTQIENCNDNGCQGCTECEEHKENE